MHSRALYTGCSYFTLTAETWTFCTVFSQHFNLHHLTVDRCGLFTNVFGIPPRRVPKLCCKRDHVVHRNALEVKEVCLLMLRKMEYWSQTVWFIICQASDLIWLRMTIKPGLVCGGNITWDQLKCICTGGKVLPPVWQSYCPRDKQTGTQSYMLVWKVSGSLV